MLMCCQLCSSPFFDSVHFQYIFTLSETVLHPS